MARKSWLTLTEIRVHSVNAQPIVSARIRLAVIDIDLTVLASESDGTRTLNNSRTKDINTSQERNRSILRRHEIQRMWRDSEMCLLSAVNLDRLQKQ